MFSYIAKRLLYFIPTFFIISFVSFGLSKLAPGDPVRLALGSTDSSAGQMTELMAGEQAYYEMAEKMGMNLPSFYFSFSSAAVPDTLYRIVKTAERDNLSRLIDQYGNWPQIEAYYHSIKAIEIGLFSVNSDSTNFAQIGKVRQNYGVLLSEYSHDRIEFAINQMVEAVQIPSMAPIKEAVLTLQNNYQTILDNATPGKNYIPSLKWYGWNNQYHFWMFGNAPLFSNPDDNPSKGYGFLRGDFGKSYADKRPVTSKVKEAIGWTLTLNMIALAISYLISIPLGVKTAVKKDSRFDRISTVILFILYSLPSFWIATMLINYFTTSEYGMNWFPTFGVSSPGIGEDTPFFKFLGDRIHHLILPIFCMTYGSFAYLSRQMRGGVLGILRMDYVRTANAKGLSEDKVIWKHVFRNSLIPIITLFAYLFPAAISGALIIEIIFQIPGMGKLSYAAIVGRDYPIVFTVLMFSAILTMVGNLAADMLYALVDPRISFSKK